MAITYRKKIDLPEAFTDWDKYKDNPNLELWKRYLLKEPYTSVFNYLNDVLIDLYEGRKLDFVEFNYLGSRFSGKTYKITDFMLDIVTVYIKKGLKVSIRGFRENSKDLKEFKDEFHRACDEKGFTRSTNSNRFVNGEYIYKEGQNQPTWNFVGGSEIKLNGIQTSKNSKTAFKGLAGKKDFDLIICVLEEANEISKKEEQSVDFSVRGNQKTQFIKFKMSNPDSKFQDYIDYCIKRVPINRHEMITKGQQMEIIVENNIGKVFHYTNYMTNEWLPEHIINKLQELKELDPVKYEIWGVGMAGGLETAVFSRYLEKVLPKKDFEAMNYFCGIDFGSADSPNGHPTAMELLGQDKFGRLKPMREYFHWNAEMIHKDSDVMANEIMRSLYEFSNEEQRIKHVGLTVYIDSGGGGAPFKTIMEGIQEQRFPHTLDWLNFELVDKAKLYHLKDRVEATITLMLRNQLFIDKDLTPWLFRQMDLMEWKQAKNKESSHKIELIDLNDDTWDAMCYAIMTQLKEAIMNPVNQLLVSK